MQKEKSVRKKKDSGNNFKTWLIVIGVIVAIIIVFTVVNYFYNASQKEDSNIGGALKSAGVFSGDSYEDFPSCGDSDTPSCTDYSGSINGVGCALTQAERAINLYNDLAKKIKQVEENNECEECCSGSIKWGEVQRVRSCVFGLCLCADNKPWTLDCEPV